MVPAVEHLPGAVAVPAPRDLLSASPDPDDELDLFDEEEGDPGSDRDRSPTPDLLARLRRPKTPDTSTGSPAPAAPTPAPAASARPLQKREIDAAVAQWRDAKPDERDKRKEVVDDLVDDPYGPVTFGTKEQVIDWLDLKVVIRARARALQPTKVDPKNPDKLKAREGNPAIGNSGGVFTVSPPRSRAFQRVEQLLRHISRVIFDPLPDATEIETMYVAGVLVIAANNAEAPRRYLVAAAERARNGDPNPVLIDQLVHALGDSTSDYRAASALIKLADVTAGTRHPWDADLAAKVAPTEEEKRDALEAQALAELIRQHAIDLTLREHAETSARLGPGGAGAPRIVFMNATNSSKVHAEQQLLRVLIDSPAVAHHATIRGAKRPCFGCSLALRYAVAHQGATNLHYDPNPGLYYLNSVVSALDGVAARPGDLSPVAGAQLDGKHRPRNHRKAAVPHPADEQQGDPRRSAHGSFQERGSQRGRSGRCQRLRQRSRRGRGRRRQTQPEPVDHSRHPQVHDLHLGQIRCRPKQRR